MIQVGAAPPDRLDDRRLTALRCKSDRWGLTAMLGVLAAFLIFVPLSIPALLGVFAAVALYGGWFLARLRANALPVGPAAAPEWGRAARECFARAGVVSRSLPVVVLQDPRANAFSMWAVNGRVIGLTSGLVTLLDEDATARLFIVGHEAGHALWHQPWSTLVAMNRALPGPLGWPARLGGLCWDRASERSADRLGLVICGSPLAAARALLALHGGLRVSDDKLRTVLASLPHRPTGLWGYFAEALADHPFLRPRLEALFAFASGPEFERVVGPAVAETARFELAELGLRPDRRGGSGWPA